MSIAGVVFACAALLSSQPSQAQQVGFPEDWSHRHVVFSNPGTYREAIENGSSEKWVRINNDPRFIMQRMKRNADASASRSQEITAAPVSELRAALRTPRRLPLRSRKKKQLAPLFRDWSVSLGAAGVAAGQYPAIFTSIGTPSCTADFAAYGVNAAGAPGGPGAQANIVGFNQLYVNSTGTGFCPVLTAPTVHFSYFVGTGKVQTSPSLSITGTKIAYIESVVGASKLHVTTIGTTGTNGTSATSPVVPGAAGGNNAADTAITLNGGVSVSVSSPYVDYTNDIAYVGDDSGKLHKFTPVFNGPPAEVIGGGWPATVNAGEILTGPVWDSGTLKVYVGDSAGKLHSVTTTGTVASSGAVAAGLGIVDAPLLDSGAERVYVFVGDNHGGTASAVVQFNISGPSLGGVSTTEPLGTFSTTTPLYIGMFDNIYFSSGGVPGPTGNLYACGNAGGEPTLYQIPISANAMQTPVAGPALASASGAGCSPVSEIYNSAVVPNDDWIFVSVPSDSCGATGGTTAGGCLMSFNVESGAVPTIGPWLPSTAYLLNDEVVDTNGNIQKVTIAGIGGTSAPSWNTSGDTGDGISPNPSVTSVSQSAAVVTLTNATLSPIPFSFSGTSGDVTLSPSGGTLGAGAKGTITLVSEDPTVGDTVTVGSITYDFVSTNPPTGGTHASPNVYEHFGTTASGNPTAEAQNLYAAITGLVSNCASGDTDCFFPPGAVVWAYQSASNGQTTVAQPTGTSGIVVDNATASALTSNIYFGTLSGTGTTNSAVKMTQAGLQ
jgi:hypothetical protein